MSEGYLYDETGQRIRKTNLLSGVSTIYPIAASHAVIPNFEMTAWLRIEAVRLIESGTSAARSGLLHCQNVNLGVGDRLERAKVRLEREAPLQAGFLLDVLLGLHHGPLKQIDKALLVVVLKRFRTVYVLDWHCQPMHDAFGVNALDNDKPFLVVAHNDRARLFSLQNAAEGTVMVVGHGCDSSYARMFENQVVVVGRIVTRMGRRCNR
ncbi:MAG: hypothetical protein V9G12_10075 [Microthrixaceae bacterium]